MLTASQYKRLPQLARAIVDADRAIISERARPTTDIKFYRQLVSDRRDLTGAADRVWGAPVRSDGTARS